MSFTEDQIQFLIEAAIEQKAVAIEQKAVAASLATQVTAQMAAQMAAHVAATAEQNKINKLVLAKLDAIESHVILIHGKVVSDFHGIESDTKKAIESTAEMVQLTEEEVETHQKLLAPTNKTKEAVLYRKQIAYYSAAKELRSYGKPLTKGEAISVGNWVSGVVSKMFGTNFKGKYPVAMRPLINQLVAYYAVERQSERMY